MSQSDVIISAWQGVRGEAFSPTLLNSQRPEHIRQRKLIRYALAMELGWSNYRIAKAECDAGQMEATYDWRKRNIKKSVQSVEKSLLSSDEYKNACRAISGDVETTIDEIAVLMEESSLTLAAMIVLLKERCGIEQEIIAAVAVEAKALRMRQLRINLTEQR